MKYLLLLCALLVGCTPAPPEPRTVALTRNWAISFPLPAEWKGDTRNEFFLKKVGRIYVRYGGSAKPEMYLARYQVKTRSVVQVAGRPSVRAEAVNSEGQEEDLLLVPTPEGLIAFELFTGKETQEQARAALQVATDGLSLRAAMPAPTVEVARERTSWPRWPFQLFGVLLLALPAALGAGFGYATSETNPSPGAARGAFSATALSYTLVGFCGAAWVVMTVSGSRSGSPIMGLFVGALVVCGCAIAGAVAGTVGGLGAALGARVNQRTSMLCAGGFALIGLLLAAYGRFH